MKCIRSKGCIFNWNSVDVKTAVFQGPSKLRVGGHVQNRAEHGKRMKLSADVAPQGGICLLVDQPGIPGCSHLSHTSGRLLFGNVPCFGVDDEYRLLNAMRFADCDCALDSPLSEGRA